MPPSSPNDPTGSYIRGYPPQQGEPRLAEHHSPTVISDTPTSNSSDASAGSGSSVSSPSVSGIDTVPLSSTFRERYQIIRVIGKGGFGTVYLAHDRTLDQQVAIKVMSVQGASPNEVKRFIFEARTSAKLRHPNIVNVYDITQDGEKLQLVMEYYPGGSMSQLIKEVGPIEPIQALEYTRQVAAGLGFAHRKGIIHRDIKPANVFLAGEGIVKLGDFGIAAQAETHEHTATGEVMGSPLYMSPEQTRDSKNIDGRSDLYSLGLTLYHMLTGKPPRVLEIERMEPALRPLLKAATAFELEDRPQTAEQFMLLADQALAAMKRVGAPAMAFEPSAPIFDPPSQSAQSSTQTAPTPPLRAGDAVTRTGTAGVSREYPPGYAGPDEATLTSPVAAAAPPPTAIRFIVASIFVLVIVMVVGFVTIIQMIRRNSTVMVQTAGLAAAPAAPGGQPPNNADGGLGPRRVGRIGERFRDEKAEWREEKQKEERDREKEAREKAKAERDKEKEKEGNQAPPVEPPTVPVQAASPSPMSASANPEPPPAEPAPAADASEQPRLGPREGPLRRVPERRPVDIGEFLERKNKETNSPEALFKEGMAAFAEWKKHPAKPFALPRANTNLESAIKLAPKNPLYHYQYGVLQEEIAKFEGKPAGRILEARSAAEKAVKAYERVKELDPGLATPGVKDADERLARVRKHIAEMK